MHDIKDEPNEKSERARTESPSTRKSEPRSPVDNLESYSEDDDSSDAGSKTPSEVEPTKSPFLNSSRLSLMSRPMNNLGYPLVPENMFTTHFPMFRMNQCMPNMVLNSSRNSYPVAQSNSNSHAGSGTDEKRNKRNRTFIDPVTEVPCLESWFMESTHPSQSMIVQYTDTLNKMAYRQKFPRLEPKNVQFWFKNRRAKSKRLKPVLLDSRVNNNLLPPERYNQLAAALSGESYRMHE